MIEEYSSDDPKKRIKRLEEIIEEQTLVILKLKRKMRELETRNKRQYERLKEIGDLMFARDWKTLELMVDAWEKQEKILQEEWGDIE